jgi:xylulokinase
LGIDVGTTAVKAALFRLDGRLQAMGSAETTLQHIRPGWVEQHPDDWWQAVCHAIRQACASVPNAAERVAGLAVSAQAPTLIALNRAGEPLRPALIWMDRRAEAEVSELEQLLGADEIFRITGNRPDAFYLAAKLRWFKNHEPELFAQAHLFVQINGYINYRLTNTFGLDNVHAGLLQLRDYSVEGWSPALCDACGVDPTRFPEIRPSHTLQGEVTAQAAQATGLRPGTPVMVGTVDGAAAALEAGAAEVGAAAEMTGTSTVLLMPNDKRLTHPALIAMPHAIPGLHLLLGATVASGASLRWYRDQFGAAEMQAGAQLKLDPFDLLTQQAALVKPGSDGVIFLPYMMGERSPLWNTHARGVLFGLSLTTSRAAVIRAILEGAAFALRHNVEVAAQAGIHLSEVRSVGGGARSALWNQIKADALGVPVLLPEASAGAPFGDALLVGMGLGLYPDIHQTVRTCVHVKTRYEPNPETHDCYQRIYSLFRRLYDHLREDFDYAAASPI